MTTMNNTDISKIISNLISDVYNFMKTKKFIDWLETDMHFRHNRDNAKRILQQMPKATLVTTEAEWKELGRSVNIDAEPILIVSDSPNIRSPTASVTGNVQLSCNQSPLLLELFDVSQTTGIPIPKLIKPLEGNSSKYNHIMDVLMKISPVPVNITNDLSPKVYGQYTGTEILINKKSSKLHQCKSAIHEMTHAMYDYRKNGTHTLSDREIRAEAVAYVVLSCIGIDSSEYSIGYIAQYLSDGNQNALSEQFTVIRNISQKLVLKIQSNL